MRDEEHKSVFAFEASWNICYTPKIRALFIGYEASGIIKRFCDRGG